jgi:signal transduction histidine kinase
MSKIVREDPTSLSFSVDAGLIDRLGRELVGRAETALSELVKNAYDADATKVLVNFVDTIDTGGTLVIKDNGVGMTLNQLKAGFMTISSTDKVHNPLSKRFKRSKAGRKGIGRFATQRLGKKLTIITQTLESDTAIKIVINWDAYKIDTTLTSIENPIEYLEKSQPEGTVLIIDHLRERWTEKDIKNVYRYVSDLLQPDYLSDRSEKIGLAKQTDETFKVSFVQSQLGQDKIIADPDKIIFSKALAVIEGYIDKAHNGYCTVTSTSLDVTDDIISVEHNKRYHEDSEPEKKYLNLNQVHFKAYYFIYNREKYYTNLSKIELSSIQKLSSEQAGIRLYRNGFRVLPYGEPNDDWLNIDRRYYNESGTNAPFGNRNLFGFVEIIDPSGQLFEETASREGIIDSDAYKELTDFVHKALEAARDRLRYAVQKLKTDLKGDKEEKSNEPEKTTNEKLDDLEKSVNDITTSTEGDDKASQKNKDDVRKAFQAVKEEVVAIMEELGMIRVLAGLGLTIGEFTHEVVQFSPSILGDLSVLGNQSLNEFGIKSLENVKRTIQVFTSYTSYFNATVSANVSRELKPQKLDQVIMHFKNIIDADLTKLAIDLSIEFFGYDLITIPMHASEWSSILFNLYTNAKKAIRRHGINGKIRIVVGKENKSIYVEFSDNGDGVPEANSLRIFEAFFTTSSPVGFDSSDNDKLTGTGLGLKIVKDIIQTYGGTIGLIQPETDYSTCFKIELPLATLKQISDYAL